MSNREKIYVGDAVYAILHNHCVELTTEDGIDVTNRIFIEEMVAHTLVDLLIRAYGLKYRKYND
jgi:hypothetical protein